MSHGSGADGERHERPGAAGEVDLPEVVWDEHGECRQTWFGDLSINAQGREAVLLVTVKEERRFRLHIPYSRIETLMQELDWARSRLAPWPANYGGPQSEEDTHA